MSNPGFRNFHIPFTFPDISCLRDDGNKFNGLRNVLEESMATSRPTTLECWELHNSHNTSEEERSGILIGCEDGTIYSFTRSAMPASTATGTQLPSFDEPPKSNNPTRAAKLSNLNSRSASPTAASFALSPTFNVTAKPRVVSGITTEQVEAPKNYVDFEDESDKLKDILKGKNPRERQSISDTNSERTPERTPKSTTSSIIEPVPLSKRKIQVNRSLLSATNSRAPTPPISPPASPKDGNASSPTSSFHELALRYHIIPSHCGSGHAVRAIQFLNDDHLFAVLQESGCLYIYSLDDGSCLAVVHANEFVHDKSLSFKEIQGSRDVWTWHTLKVLYIEDSIVLMATAENDNDASALTSDTEATSSGSSRCLLFELDISSSEVHLRTLGQLAVSGPAFGIGFLQEYDGTYTLFSMSYDGHFITREFKLRAPPPSTPVQVANSPKEKDNGHHPGTHLHTLPIPNPFKSMMSRSSEHLIIKEDFSQTPNGEKKAWFSEPYSVGIITSDTSLCGLRTYHYEEGSLFGIAWCHRDLAAFKYSARTLTPFFHASIQGIKDAEWLDQRIYALSFEDRVEVYEAKFVNSDNEEIATDASTNAHVEFELVRTIQTGFHDTIQISASSFIVTKFSEDKQQIIWHSLVDKKAAGSSQNASQSLWEANPVKSSGSKIILTSALPLELELIIHGYSDGYLRQFSLGQMARKDEKSSVSTALSMKTSNPALSGHLLGLYVVQNQRTRERYVVGGADDGSIAFWLLNTFELVAHWAVFITPLSKVVQFQTDNTGPLRGCALCVSRDGSIAIIVIDGFHFLYLIPGSSSPLKRICLGGNNLLLIYSDHRARLWDAQTKELWRSMGQDKAEELLAQGGWSELALENDACVPKTYWTTIAKSPNGQDAAASLALDLEQFVVDAISVTKTISTSRDEVREILLALDRLRLILSALLTPGLNSDVDSICYGKLGAYPSSIMVGLSSFDTTTLYRASHPQDPWCLSSKASASRALAIIAVLRAMSLFEELTEGANAVTLFFTTSLGSCVGPNFKPPSLEFLGQLWFDASNEFRQPIRTLFEATIANFSDEESIKVAEKWQHHVPSLQPDAEKETLKTALALFICGCIAADKYSLLSVNALMDISKSISLYLHDEKSIYRVLAIDLCSRGFNVWQHYIDSMEILRSLFDLATSVRKDSISIQNVGAQARLAVLSIATHNMPLFMGTLCLDILTPPSVQHRRSVLQILAFLIRKRPHVLQPHLPRLMEAVVKSLDPNSTSDRDIVLDTATEIIGYVVKTFPTVDFHMSTQRLAVGTNEGAVVMYDLKTAIRLYVLEGHKKQITACSFSPDGRRLVTISLKESVVLAWKVGSSFASFFNPGAPPRQGHGGSQPFKTLNFNIGSEADMTTAETLDLVRVEWIADRSVKVKIRQSVLTFST